MCPQIKLSMCLPSRHIPQTSSWLLWYIMIIPCICYSNKARRTDHGIVSWLKPLTLTKALYCQIVMIIVLRTNIPSKIWTGEWACYAITIYLHIAPKYRVSLNKSQCYFQQQERGAVRRKSLITQDAEQRLPVQFKANGIAGNIIRYWLQYQHWHQFPSEITVYNCKTMKWKWGIVPSCVNHW